MSDCVAEIQNMFADKLLLPGVSPTTDLLETGLLDSMTLVELLFNLERQFGYQANLAELDLENLRSIQRIASLIEPVPLPSKAAAEVNR
jgi:acyl carrier protein